MLPATSATSQQNIVLPGVHQYPPLQHVSVCVCGGGRSVRGACVCVCMGVCDTSFFVLHQMVAPGQAGRLPLIHPPNMLWQAQSQQQLQLQSLTPAFPSRSFPTAGYPARHHFTPIPPAVPSMIGVGGANTSLQATALQQQLPPMSSFGAGPRVGGGAKRKVPSKAIRIVDPSTMEEVDVTGSGSSGGSGSGAAATAPAPTVSRPSNEQLAVRNQFQQQVQQTVAKPPNAIITPPPPPESQHQVFPPPKVARLQPEEMMQGGIMHTPNPHAQTFYPGMAPPGPATGQVPSFMIGSEHPPLGATNPALLDTSPGRQVAGTSSVQISANGHPAGLLPAPVTKPLATTLKPEQISPLLGAGEIPMAVVQPLVATQPSLMPQQHQRTTQIPVKPVSEPAQPVVVAPLDGVKTAVIASEQSEHKQLHLLALDQGSKGQNEPSIITSVQTHNVETADTKSSTSVVPETGESTKSDDLATPPTSLVVKETAVVQETVSKETDSKEMHSDLKEPIPTDSLQLTHETVEDAMATEGAPDSTCVSRAEVVEETPVVGQSLETADTKPPEQDLAVEVEEGERDVCDDQTEEGEREGEGEGEVKDTQDSQQTGGEGEEEEEVREREGEEGEEMREREEGVGVREREGEEGEGATEREGEEGEGVREREGEEGEGVREREGEEGEGVREGEGREGAEDENHEAASEDVAEDAIVSMTDPRQREGEREEEEEKVREEMREGVTEGKGVEDVQKLAEEEDEEREEEQASEKESVVSK